LLVLPIVFRLVLIRTPSAAQRRATGCRRLDEPTSVRKFRVAPRDSYVPLDLDQLPDRFRAGRSGWHKTKFCSAITMGLFSSNGLPGSRLTEAEAEAAEWMTWATEALAPSEIESESTLCAPTSPAP
jgi:hypothetical protein